MCVCVCVCVCVCLTFVNVHVCVCGVGGCRCGGGCFTFVNVHNIICSNCRNFHFELYPDTSVFSDDFRLSVDGRLRRNADMSVYYSGRAVGTYVCILYCVSVL